MVTTARLKIIQACSGLRGDKFAGEVGQESSVDGRSDISMSTTSCACTTYSSIQYRIEYDMPIKNQSGRISSLLLPSQDCREVKPER